MALLIDTPRWPAHERLWAHLISDTSLVELHAFAQRAGVPSRSFDGDHYDIPAERHLDVVAAGARWVAGRELVEALRRSGLRLPKRKGERVLATWPHATWPSTTWPSATWPSTTWPTGEAAHHLDCIASTLVPVGTGLASWLIALDDEGRLALDGDRLPLAAGTEPRLGYLRLRPVVERRSAGQGGRGGQWQHVALHLARDLPGGLSRVRLDRVDGVLAQEHWWPLVLHAQHRSQ